MTDYRGRQLLRCRQKKCRNCTAHFIPFAHKCPLPETPEMSLEQSNSRLFPKPLSTCGRIIIPLRWANECQE
jgi:hypothetical protein